MIEEPITSMAAACDVDEEFRKLKNAFQNDSEGAATESIIEISRRVTQALLSIASSLEMISIDIAQQRNADQ